MIDLPWRTRFGQPVVQACLPLPRKVDPRHPHAAPNVLSVRGPGGCPLAWIVLEPLNRQPVADEWFMEAWMFRHGMGAHRTFDRAPFCGTVALCRQRNSFPVQPVDIGGGGILLKTDHLLPEKALVTLRINLPLPGQEPQGFTVLGRVVRCRPGEVRPADPGVAVEFLDIMPRDRERIRKYVAAVLGQPDVA